MKKKIFFIVILFVLAISIVVTMICIEKSKTNATANDHNHDEYADCPWHPDPDINDYTEMSLDYIGEADVDLSLWLEGYGDALKNPDQYTWYYSFSREESLNRFLQEDLKVSQNVIDFDFSNNYLVISVGRPLKKLYYSPTDTNEVTKGHWSYPEFDMSSYGYKAYFYSIEQIKLIDTEILGYGYEFGDINLK